MLLNEISSNQFFTTRKETENWLIQMKIVNYIINPKTLEVDVLGDVDLDHKIYKTIPIKFKYIQGNFNCSHTQLINLFGSPDKIDGNFICRQNQLNTLLGSPNYVGGTLDCCYNKLTTLQGSPNYIGDDFACMYNQLSTLKGITTQYVHGDFRCNNNNLISLEGMPNNIMGDIVCYSNPLESLRGCPANVNKSLTFDGQQHILKTIHNFIKSAENITLIDVQPDVVLFMWVFLIKSVQSITLIVASEEQHTVAEIINKHLQSDRSGPACQIELIDAGLGEYIKL